jgi:hypothetical protein
MQTTNSHTLQVILGNNPGSQQQLHRRPDLTATAGATSAVRAAAAGARIDVDAADFIVQHCQLPVRPQALQHNTDRETG